MHTNDHQTGKYFPRVFHRISCLENHIVLIYLIWENVKKLSHRMLDPYVTVKNIYFKIYNTQLKECVTGEFSSCAQ